MSASINLKPIAPADVDLVRRRRDLLSTAPNPRPGLNYLASLQQQLPMDVLPADMRSPAMLAVRFVPDRLILAAGALPRFATELASQEWSSPEALATAVFDDINNELVPRWLNLRLDAGDGHRIVLEDRQPGWDAAHLLDRLEAW